MERREAEQKIYDLMADADLALQAGNAEEHNRIQRAIAQLQREHGVTVGKGTDEDLI